MRKKKIPPKIDPIKMRRAILLAVAMIGGPIIVVGLVLLPWIIPLVRHEILKTRAKEFADPPANREVGQPYIKGKAIVIDREKSAVDPIQNRLPTEIRAFSKDEVESVVLLEWDFEAVQGGRWGATTSHFSKCKVTIVDRTRDAIIGEHTVMGASSPVTTGGGGKYRAPPGVMTATRCNDQAIGYLSSLPRR